MGYSAVFNAMRCKDLSINYVNNYYYYYYSLKGYFHPLFLLSRVRARGFENVDSSLVADARVVEAAVSLRRYMAGEVRGEELSEIAEAESVVIEWALTAILGGAGAGGESDAEIDENWIASLPGRNPRTPSSMFEFVVCGYEIEWSRRRGVQLRNAASFPVELQGVWTRSQFSHLLKAFEIPASCASFKKPKQGRKKRN